MKPHEKSTQGLALIKEAIVDVLQSSAQGLRNAEIADLLDLHSDYLGAQKDYLSWSVLGLLMNEGIVTRTEGKRYVLSQE